MYILGSVLAFSALSFCVGPENNSQLVETAPSIKTCRVTTSPVIDGKLTDDCWREAEAATDFWRSNGLSRIESSASVQLAYDDENLFVGFRCPLPNPQSVTAAKDFKPNQMFDRNTVQVFLDPLLDHRRDVGLAKDPDALFYTHPGPKIFRFAVNPVNGRFSDLLGFRGGKFLGGAPRTLETVFGVRSLRFPLRRSRFSSQPIEAVCNPDGNQPGESIS